MTFTFYFICIVPDGMCLLLTDDKQNAKVSCHQNASSSSSSSLRWDEGECDTGREESILVRHRALARPLVHMWGFGEYVG